MKNKAKLQEFLANHMVEAPREWVKSNGVSPVVSLVVCTYNHEDWIGDCLDAIECQTMVERMEVVVGVDRCSDNTLQKVLDWKEVTKVPEVLVLDIPEANNVRIFGRRSGMFNFFSCLQRLNGQYYGWCDGDDVWLNNRKLEAQIKAMELADAPISWFRTTNAFTASELNDCVWKEVTQKEVIVPNEVGPCSSTVLFKGEALDGEDLVVNADHRFIDVVVYHSVLSGGGRGILGSARMAYRRVHGAGLYNGLRWKEQNAMKLLSTIKLSRYFGFVGSVWTSEEEYQYCQELMEYPSMKSLFHELTSRLKKRFL